MGEDIRLGDWLLDHDSAADQKKTTPKVLETIIKPAAANANTARRSSSATSQFRWPRQLLILSESARRESNSL